MVRSCGPGHAGQNGLAAVTSAKPLDRFVAHRRPAIRIQELSSVARTVVVLQCPHSGGQVVLWVAQARATEVDEAAEATVLDQDVGQAVIAMDEHVALARPAELAASGVDRVNVAKDLAQPARDG